VRQSVRTLAAVVAMALVLPVAAAHADGLYIAMGDSTTMGYTATDWGRDGYVGVFGAWLARPENGGVDQVRNRAVFGESSVSARGDQLRTALADIAEPSDTKVVTVELGINDRWFECPYGFNLATCPLAGDLTAIIQELQNALAQDPGPERLLILEYFNPIRGGDVNDLRWWDDRLVGYDRKVDCSGTGGDLAYNDLVACIAVREGAEPVDPYGLFKAHGDDYLDGATHPNDAGHHALAELLEDPSRSGTTPPDAFIAPNVVTGDSSQVTSGTAIVTGDVNPNGVPTSWRAEFGPTAAYGTVTRAHPVEPSSTEYHVGDGLTGLQPGTTYHYRLTATNRYGTRIGGDATFTTAGTPEPAARGVRLSSVAVLRGRTLSIGFAVNPPATTTEQTLSIPAPGGAAGRRGARRVLGAGRTVVPAGGRRALTVRVSRAIEARLRSRRTRSVVASVRANDGTGAAATVTRRLRVRVAGGS
jgi:lysophospholipase L1-like esterase